jgi:outer membrane receptor protein involved in Fe transport
LVIGSEVLLEMPIMRDLTSVALLAPGTSAGDNRFGNLASFGGASVAENTSFINGLNTTNFRTGVGFSEVPFEFYDTIQIKTGGYSAKYGRSLGGVMNATAKSGSNEWDFGFNAYYNEELETQPNTFAAANKLDENESVTGDVYLSGPIIKDRLFFYALYSDDTQEQRYAGIQSKRDYDYEIDEGFWGVKLDGYITPDHHIEYTAFSDERTGVETVYGFDPTNFQRGALVGDTLYERGGDNWIATYTGNFGDDLQVSLSYGENEANRTTAPASASVPVVYEYDGGFGALGEWSNFTVSQGLDKREMMRADITWTGFSGHELSAGIDNEENSSDEATKNSGGVYWLRDPTNAYNECTPTECPQGANVRRRNYSVGGSFTTNSDAYYIQDVWEVNDRLTLELGIRNETFENLNADGGVFVEVKDQWAPRLSAVYDPTGEGQSKIFANYGEYYLPIAANTNIRMAGNETYIHDYYDWDGVSADAQFVPTNLGPALCRIPDQSQTLILTLCSRKNIS